MRNDEDMLLRGFDKTCSPVTRLFFSPENIEILQKKLVLEVFKRVSVKVPFQSEDRLMIAMKHVHDVYAQHLPCNLKQQVTELDEHLVDWVLPDMITAVEQTIAYEKYITEPRPLLEPPVSVGRSKGPYEVDRFLAEGTG